MATTPRKILKVKIDDSDVLRRLGMANQHKTIAVGQDVDADTIEKNVVKQLIRGLTPNQKEELEADLEKFQLADQKDGKLQIFESNDKPLEGKASVPTTFIYYNRGTQKEREREREREREKKKESSRGSIVGSGGSAPPDSPASAREGKEKEKEKESRVRFTRHKSETDREFAQRRVALGWINNRMTLGGFEPFVDIVSDLYTGVPLSHLIDTLTPGNPIKVDPVLDGNKLKCINNISASLAALGDFLDVKHIGPQNLYDQIYASVMGIVWKIIEFFHTEVPIREMLSDMHDPIDPSVKLTSTAVTNDYLAFTNRRLMLLPVRCRPRPVFNFTTSFSDGKSLLGITASYDKTFLATIDNSDIPLETQLKRAFGRAQTLYEIPPILAVEDILVNANPKSIICYLAYFRIKVKDETSAHGSGDKRSFHVQCARESDFDSDVGFLVNTPREIYLNVFDDLSVEGDTPEEMAVASDQAYSAVFRNVKVEQPGESFLSYECVDAGCIDSKRQVKLKLTPQSTGKHVFLIFDEVDGTVTSQTFNVISPEAASELKKKKSEEEEERRDHYRKLEEKRRLQEEQRRAKTPQEKKLALEASKAKLFETVKNVVGLAPIKGGLQLLKTLSSKIEERRKSIKEEEKEAKEVDIKACEAELDSLKEPLSRLTSLSSPTTSSSWADDLASRFENVAKCMGETWAVIDETLTTDNLVIPAIHQASCDKFLEIIKLLSEIPEAISDKVASQAKMKERMATVMHQVEALKIDISYGESLRSLMSDVKDAEKPIEEEFPSPLPPPATPVPEASSSDATPPRSTERISSSASQPVIAQQPKILSSSTSTSSIETKKKTPRSPGSKPLKKVVPASPMMSLRSSKDVVIVETPVHPPEIGLLVLLNSLTSIMEEVDAWAEKEKESGKERSDLHFVLSKGSQLSTLSKKLTQHCRTSAAIDSENSSLYLSVPASLNQCILSIVRETKSYKEKFLELRKLVGQGRLDFCQGFPHLKEFSDLVGQVTKEVDKEASFDRWLALWHSREVFTLQKFKSFLTSEEWPDFPLPLTAKKAFEHFKSGKKANEEEQDSVLDEEEEVHPVEKETLELVDQTIGKLLKDLEASDEAIGEGRPIEMSSIFKQPKENGYEIPEDFKFPDIPKGAVSTHDYDLSLKKSLRQFSELFESLAEALLFNENLEECKKKARNGLLVCLHNMWLDLLAEQSRPKPTLPEPSSSSRSNSNTSQEEQGLNKALMEKAHRMVRVWGFFDQESRKKPGSSDSNLRGRRISDMWASLNAMIFLVERVPVDVSKFEQCAERLIAKHNQVDEKLEAIEHFDNPEEFIMDQAECMEKVADIDRIVTKMVTGIFKDPDSPVLLEHADEVLKVYEEFLDFVVKLYTSVPDLSKRDTIRATSQIYVESLRNVFLAFSNPRFNLKNYVDSFQALFDKMQIDLGVSEVRTADSVLVQHVKSRKFLGSTSGQFADVSPIVLTYDLSSQSSSLDDFNEEIKNEWKFEFGVLLDSAPTTHKCLIKNAVSEEFFGPDPYFFETELHDVELCTTLLQKDSSEWNAELWCDDGNAGESAADRRGSVKFVLRNAFTLKYLCVVDRETTWADSPTIDCVFTVSGPGARPISDRLRPPPLDPVALRRKQTMSLPEYIVEWDFEGDASGEISVEAGEIVFVLPKQHNPEWLKIKRKDMKIGYIPSLYAKPYVQKGQSLHIIAELARDPSNRKELIIESDVPFTALKQCISNGFSAQVSVVMSLAGYLIESITQLRPYDRVVVELEQETEEDIWRTEESRMATDEDIFATLAEQRMPPADWYKKKSTTEEAKGLLRVFLSEDPTLSKYGLSSSVFTIKYFGITMRAAHLKAAVKDQMCRKLATDPKQELLEYTKRFVIVEVGEDSHRVVSRREPLGKWEISVSAEERLMYVPILSHFNFRVEYPSHRVKINSFFVVRIYVTDPIHLDRSVDQMEADLAVWVKSSLGTETEYEMSQEEGKRGCFMAKLKFSTAGRYRACVKFDGFPVQNKNTSLHVMKGQGLLSKIQFPTFHFRQQKDKVSLSDKINTSTKTSYPNPSGTSSKEKEKNKEKKKNFRKTMKLP